jgi:hypothetical protein
MGFHAEACIPVISHWAFVSWDEDRPGPFPIAAGESLIPILVWVSKVTTNLTPTLPVMV